MTRPLGKKFNSQRGIAALAILAMILLVITSVLVVTASLDEQSFEITGDSSAALVRARQELIGYALRSTPPGLLPCPDFDGDGESDDQGSGSGATCRTRLGFFPYVSVNSEMILDGDGQRLWYAVELNYAREVTGQALNPSLSSSLLDQTQASAPENLAAVLLSPGVALDSQSRLESDNANRYAQYLEGINGDSDTQIFAQALSDSNNDILLTISNLEYWATISALTTKVVLASLNDYYSTTGCSAYPWASNDSSLGSSQLSLSAGYIPFGATIASGGTTCPSALTLPASDWVAQHWADQFHYVMCPPSTPACLNISGDTSGTADTVVISPGVALSTQARPSVNLSDYFEDENNNADQNFEYRALKNLDEQFNDVLVSQ